MKIKGIKSLCSLTQKLELTGLHVVAFYDPKKNAVFGRVLTRGSYISKPADCNLVEFADYIKTATMGQIQNDLSREMLKIKLKKESGYWERG
ncbi:hypothetical protein [Acidaminococcus massiliensis]|jgi:hypothetical protein|uniref:hypothetical protein n=1 Tax=Acidaminococcus massiliensis TaxID=1852375 RepID=UPI00205B5EA2|nr:hypothetical protein [Acidaminococcus massiliensis]DAR24927.1 MAG TPA: hypothetical protein [Caudoviricetes sp.]